MIRGYAIVQLMNNQQIAGFVEETAIAETTFLKLEEYSDKNEPAIATHYLNPAIAVYTITMVSQDTACEFTANNLKAEAIAENISVEFRFEDDESEIDYSAWLEEEYV